MSKNARKLLQRVKTCDRQLALLLHKLGKSPELKGKMDKGRLLRVGGRVL